MEPQPLVDWVGDRMTGTRVPQKLRRTILSGIGARHRTDEMVRGERILLGPDGKTRIAVFGYENGSIAVEHGDHRHALVRPRTIRYGMRQDPPAGLLRQILRSKR